MASQQSFLVPRPSAFGQTFANGIPYGVGTPSRNPGVDYSDGIVLFLNNPGCTFSPGNSWRDIYLPGKPWRDFPSWNGGTFLLEKPWRTLLSGKPWRDFSSWKVLKGYFSSWQALEGLFFLESPGGTFLSLESSGGTFLFLASPIIMDLVFPKS